MMEGGGAMEGEGVVEGGGAHLGSSLPMSVHVRGRSSSFVRIRLRSCAFVMDSIWINSGKVKTSKGTQRGAAGPSGGPTC